MNIRRLIATAFLSLLLLSGCAAPRYDVTPPGTPPLLLREPQERLVNGGRLVFPKGTYHPVAVAHGGVLYLPQGYVYAPLAERHFRAGVLVPLPNMRDTRQGVWELDDHFASDTMSGKIAIARFEPALAFESLP